jgi:predicted Ser/Thr protein kinase
MNDESTLFSGSPTAAGTARAAASPLPFFPGFEVVAEVAPGVGGMGVVYKARELALDRVVALKTLRADRDAPPLRELFVREARAAAQLDHPNILRIHRFCPEHAPPFFVMQYVDGRPLDRACAGRDFPFVAAQLEKVARALAYAHDCGIVHRDVKPANVLVDADGEPHVADFGLALRAGDPTDPAVATAGTPVCMAPELYSGGAAFSPAVDVYALGVTAYRLLTGAWPYDAADPVVLRDAVLRGDPPLPQEISPRVPEPLQRICLKAMERDPDDRYASAADMAEDLRRFREGRDVAARPTRYGRELHGKLRNHLTELQLWREQGLLDVQEYDRLSRPARLLVESPYPWHQLSRRFPWATVLLRLGGWLVLLASVLWVGFYWHHLSAGQRVTAIALPTLATSAVGWTLWWRGSRVNAQIFLAMGVLLLPLLACVVLTEGQWLVHWQGDARELFGAFRHDAGDDDPDGAGRAGAVARRLFEPSNLELTTSVAAFVAYCLVLLRVTRAATIGVWLFAGVYLLHTGFLLLAGALEWVRDEHVSRLLLWYLPVPAACWVASRLLARRAPGVAAIAFGFVPLPLVLCLTPLAWFGAAEWLGAERRLDAAAVNLWWMADGAAYLALALVLYHGRRGYVRFWGPPLMILAGLHLSGPANNLFTRGPELFPLGRAAVTPYELAAVAIALTTSVLGTRLRMHALALPGLFALAVFVFRATARHFPDALPWPFTLACLGGAAMIVATMLLVRQPPPPREARQTS